ncbi:hypothetical protein EJB05_50100, partial [Eragrostis curvula]
MWTRPGLPSAETRTSRGQKRAIVVTRLTNDSETPGSWGTKRPRTRQPRRRPNPKCCWASLTYGPAGLIAERALANGVEDYLSFRAVCREWRRSAKAIAVRAQGCLDRRFYPSRWIMLRDAALPGSGSSRRRFLNVSTGECVQTELPELDDAQGHHHLLGATAEGLLALLDTSTYAVRLLNPLTRQLAELPSLYPLLPAKTLDDIADDGLAGALEVRGLGLAAASDNATDDDVALALCFIKPVMLVAAKPGDGSWTLVHGDERWFYSATSFAGRFYCADGRSVMALEPTTADEPPRLVVVAKITIRVSHIGNDTVHLVVKGGGADEEELLLLYRGQRPQEDDPYARWRMKYVAFRVDLATRETVPLTGLGAGGIAVFLGEERALSVPHGVFPTISADTVYLGFDLFEREYEKLCAYCLLDGTTECSIFSSDDGWARPCDIVDYLSWYVSGTGTCEGIEDI